MKKVKRIKQKGFVALFTVIIIGFLATIFVISASSKVWAQAKGVTEAQAKAAARFDAISCLNIARQKIFLNENPIVDDPEILGIYDVPNGRCTIESLGLSSSQIIVHASSINSGVELEGILDSNTLDIVSIQEL